MSNLGDFGIPNPALPLGQGQDSKGADVSIRLSDVWHKFLVRLSQLNAEKAITVLTPTASPWSYTATTIGHLYLRNGTISTKTLTRGSVTVNLDTAAGFVPMAAGDVVTTTYSVLPTANFVPGARA